MQLAVQSGCFKTAQVVFRFNSKGFRLKSDAFGQPCRIRSLVQHQIIHLKDWDGDRITESDHIAPLSYAVQHRSLVVAKTLIELGADIN